MQHYSRSLTCRDHFIHQLETFLQHWDVWLCPVMPGLAFEHKQTLKFLGSPVGGWLPVDEGLLPYWQWGITFTCIFNLMGNPVVTLPIRHLQKLDFTSSSTRASNSISEISISFTQVGLPIGVQVVGRRWQDMQLLAVADIIISQVS
jgi:amidase